MSKNEEEKKFYLSSAQFSLDQPCHVLLKGCVSPQLHILTHLLHCIDFLNQ